MSKTTYKGDIVHTEKYTDKQSGEEKKKYTRVGALFEREDGSLCVNFFGSWLNVYPPKVGEKDFQQAKQAIQPDNALKGGGGAFDDEIPFDRLKDIMF